MFNNIVKRINNKKGFTLVELIVVIAVLGILAGIAVPRFGGVQETAKKKADIANAKTIYNSVSAEVAMGSIASTVTYDVLTTGTGAEIPTTDIEKAQKKLVEDIGNMTPKSTGYTKFQVIVNAGVVTVKISNGTNAKELMPNTDATF